MRKGESFSLLTIPLVHYIHDDEGSYLVYSDEANFVNIKAATAFEALDKSGIKKPYMVMHLLPYLTKSVLKDTEIAKENTSPKPTEPLIN